MAEQSAIDRAGGVPVAGTGKRARVPRFQSAAHARHRFFRQLAAEPERIAGNKPKTRTPEPADGLHKLQGHPHQRRPRIRSAGHGSSGRNNANSRDCQWQNYYLQRRNGNRRRRVECFYRCVSSRPCETGPPAPILKCASTALRSVGLSRLSMWPAHRTA